MSIFHKIDANKGKLLVAWFAIGSVFAGIRHCAPEFNNKACGAIWGATYGLVTGQQPGDYQQPIAPPPAYQPVANSSCTDLEKIVHSPEAARVMKKIVESPALAKSLSGIVTQQEATQLIQTVTSNPDKLAGATQALATPAGQKVLDAVVNKKTEAGTILSQIASTVDGRMLIRHGTRYIQKHPNGPAGCTPNL
jgi:hypothetical protein